MNDPLLEEWLQKAQSDWIILNRLWTQPSAEIADGVCFHAQQCVEKLLKAAVHAYGGKPPKTHDLVVLSECLRENYPACFFEMDDLRFLTKAAVDFRYPGEFAMLEDAKEAVGICTMLRQELLNILEGNRSWREK